MTLIMDFICIIHVHQSETKELWIIKVVSKTHIFLSDTFVLSSPAEASAAEHILRFRAVNYTMY